MLERFKNVEEHKQASKQTLKLATKFVRQFSKPMKRWKWACQQIIKTEKAKKMRQAGEIVDMAAINYSIDRLHEGLDDINEKDNSFSHNLQEMDIRQLAQEVSKHNENQKFIENKMLDKRKRMSKL